MQEKSLEYAIEISQLKKNFSKVEVLKGLSLKVPMGAAFAFVGPNGAGKTTLIKILLGICHADSGEIRILGKEPHQAEVRQHIGYLPENIQISPAFTPFQFLSSVARLRGVKKSDWNSELERVLSLVGLEKEVWQRKCGQFSKGMKQRTGLAAALIGKPKLLVLDEPTDGIDPLGRKAIKNAIKEFQQSGGTVFLNSHLLAESEEICDYVAVIDQGTIVRTGRITDFKEHELFELEFYPHSEQQKLALAAGFRVEHALNAGANTLYTFSMQNPEELSRALTVAFEAGLLLKKCALQEKNLEEIFVESLTVKNGGL